MSVLRIDHLNRSFGSLVVTDDVNLAIARGRAPRHHRAERRRQDQPDQSDRRPARSRAPAASSSKDSDITGWSPDRISRMGVARTFQRNNLFQNLSVIENLRLALEVRRGNPLDFFTPVGRNAGADRARARTLMAQVHLDGDGDAARAQSFLRRAAPARNRHRAGRRARACCCWTSRPRACRRPRPRG